MSDINILDHNEEILRTEDGNTVNMWSSILVLAASVCYASSYTEEERWCRKDPMFCAPNNWFSLHRMASRPGEITWNKPAGGGKVFGTLGSTDQGLFGQAGYKQVIFNDARGKLEGQAHGTRVLGPNGDSSHLGGKLEWANDNAKAALEVNKQIGEPASVSASGAGKWKLDKNTEVSAGGSVTQTGHGKPDVAVGATIEHKF